MRSLADKLTQKVLKNYCGLRQWLSLKLNDFADSRDAATWWNLAATWAFPSRFYATAAHSRMNAASRVRDRLQRHGSFSNKPPNSRHLEA
jgi:hypothetical protein